MKENIPLIRKPKNYNELPIKIVKLIVERNKARRNFQKTGLPCFRKLKNMLSNKVRDGIYNHNNEQWNLKLINLKLSDNSLWQTA